MSLAVLVLAAGASSRMRGRDKLLEEVAGAPLLRRQVSAALTVCDQVYVTLPAKPHPRYDILEGLPVEITPVPDAQDGMGTSLATGIRTLPEGAQGALLLLPDMPEITAAYMQKLIHLWHSDMPKQIIQATTQDGTPGHPVLFGRAYFPALSALSGDQGARAILRQNKDSITHCALPGQAARLDLDTPEAWTAWRATQR